MSAVPDSSRRWSLRRWSITALCAGLVAVAGTTTAYAVVPDKQSGPGNTRYVEASAPSIGPAIAGAAWRGKYTYNVDSGLHKLFFHYECPSGQAISGHFKGYPATEESLQLIGEGPRLDLGAANYTAWFWVFVWPSGAPAGTAIDFDVYCG
jgi:hypothetical protein